MAPLSPEYEAVHAAILSAFLLLYMTRENNPGRHVIAAAAAWNAFIAVSALTWATTVLLDETTDWRNGDVLPQPMLRRCRTEGHGQGDAQRWEDYVASCLITLLMSWKREGNRDAADVAGWNAYIAAFRNPEVPPHQLDTDPLNLDPNHLLTLRPTNLPDAF